MNMRPSFEPTEPKPKPAWVSAILVTVFVSIILAAIAIHILQDAPSWVWEWASRPQTRIIKGKQVADFTIFTREKLPNGFVDTGREYKNSEDEFPSRQYCYVQLRKENSRVDLNVTLGTQQGSKPVKETPLTIDDAAIVGLPLAELKALMASHCRFQATGGG